MTPEQEHQVSEAVARILQLRGLNQSDENIDFALQMEGYAARCRQEAWKRVA